MKKISFFIQLLVLTSVVLLISSSIYVKDVYSFIAVIQFFIGVYQVLAFFILVCFARVRHRMWPQFQVYAGMVVITMTLIFILFNVNFNLEHQSKELILFSMPWIPAVYFCYLSYIIGFEKYSANNTKHYLDL